MEKLAVDKEFQKRVGEYNSASELSYIRMENSVLRAFDSIPGIEVSNISNAILRPLPFSPIG